MQCCGRWWHTAAHERSAEGSVHVRVQITRGLLQKYGAERVRDTPITEVRPLYSGTVRTDRRRQALQIMTAPVLAAACRLASQA
jgi:hypothetical protein